MATGGASRGPVAPPSPQDLAYIEALKAVGLSMTPEQILQFRRMIDQTERAIAAPVGVDPIPRAPRSIELSLRPGESHPVISSAPGRVATLTFSDVTGRPWPVQSVHVPDNQRNFNASAAGQQGLSNIVVVAPLQPYAVNNMVVTLVGHPVPVVVELRAGDREIDYRVDLKIASRGPNAAYDVTGISTLPPVGDTTLMAFLDGTPPPSARRLRSNSREVEAWLLDDVMYVRTPFELLSPAYVSRAANVSGVKVYTLNEAPILLLGSSGNMVSVSVKAR
jgi:intracellular multiplication protein IcmK